MDFIGNNKAHISRHIHSSHMKSLLCSSEISWEQIWPKLKLVSCWNEAQAKYSCELLKKKLNHTHIQGKGLLLTEAPISIPWNEAKGNVPLVTETYLEFLDEQGNILGITELEKGASYVVLTSQFNGFLRYNTSDKVRVTGYYFQTPILEFIGRIGNHSDMVGEKLSEELIRSMVKADFFFLLVPNQSDQPNYEIYVDEDTFNQHPKEIEHDLIQIHHYQLARDLRQLSPLITLKIKNLSQRYHDFQLSLGVRLGDIKEKVLICDPLQAEKFRKWIGKELQSSHQES